MSVKALRYSHDKNCKGKTPTIVEAPAPAPAQRTSTHKVPEEEPPTPRHTPVEQPKEIPPKTKLTRSEVRQKRLNSLVSQAF